MDYFVHFRIRGVYVRAHDLPEDEPGIVLHDARVLDVNAAALHQGIKLGARDSEAKTLLKGTGRWVTWNPDFSRPLLEQWQTTVHEFVDEMQTHGHHAATLNLGAHPAPGQAAVDLLGALVRAGWSDLRFGAGEAPWLAKLATLPIDETAARLGVPCFEHLSLNDGRVEQAPLNRLPLLKPEVARRLQLLGYRTLLDLQKAPRTLFKNWFKDEAAMLQALIEGRYREPWIPNVIAQRVTVRQLFDSPLDQTETLAHFRRELSYRLAAELCRRGVDAQKIRLEVRPEFGQPWEHATRLTKPSSAPQALHRTTERLWGQWLVPSAVEGMVLTAEEFRQAQYTQLNLESRTARAGQDALIHRVVDRMQQRFGQGTLKRATELPVDRRTLWMRYWREVTGWR